MARDGNDRDQGAERPAGEADLEARRRALDERLAAVDRQRTEVREREERKGSDPTGMSRGFRYSADFVSGVLVGCGLGWLTDQVFGTRPWGLMVFIVLGFAAGTFNILRLAERERRQR